MFTWQRWFGGALVGALIAVAGAAQAWERYENARFGTVVDIPADQVTAGPAPANGDGLAWATPDGDTKLQVYGALWVASNESWDDYRVKLRRWMLQDGIILTYAPEGVDWFVLSGKDGDRIVYLRVNQSGLCPDVAHHLRIEYPANQQDVRAAWVERMSKSLSEGDNAMECG